MAVAALVRRGAVQRADTDRSLYTALSAARHCTTPKRLSGSHSDAGVDGSVERAGSETADRLLRAKPSGCRPTSRLIDRASFPGYRRKPRSSCYPHYRCKVLRMPCRQSPRIITSPLVSDRCGRGASSRCPRARRCGSARRTGPARQTVHASGQPHPDRRSPCP